MFDRFSTVRARPQVKGTKLFSNTTLHGSIANTPKTCVKHTVNETVAAKKCHARHQVADKRTRTEKKTNVRIVALSLCVRACVGAWVRVRVCVCACACARGVRACVFSSPGRRHIQPLKIITLSFFTETGTLATKRSSRKNSQKEGGEEMRGEMGGAGKLTRGEHATHTSACRDSCLQLKRTTSHACSFSNVVRNTTSHYYSSSSSLPSVPSLSAPTPLPTTTNLPPPPPPASLTQPTHSSLYSSSCPPLLRHSTASPSSLPTNKYTKYAVQANKMLSRQQKQARKRGTHATHTCTGSVTSASAASHGTAQASWREATIAKPPTTVAQR